MKKNNILLISLIFIFITITILVYNGFTLKIDNIIYQYLIAFKNDNLTNFFMIITKCCNAKFCIILLLFILILFRNKFSFFLIVNSMAIEFINLLVKFILKRDRPNILKLIVVDNYSYPSGHAMISMGIYGLIIYFIYKNVSNKILKYLFISILTLLIILIGISRIYLGVHYFTDVVAGYILSLICLIFSVKIIRVRGIFNV